MSASCSDAHAQDGNGVGVGGKKDSDNLNKIGKVGLDGQFELIFMKIPELKLKSLWKALTIMCLIKISSNIYY